MRNLFLIGYFIFNLSTAPAVSNADYAKLYSDELLKSFDLRLDQKILLNDIYSPILEEITYARLLSARAYLDHEANTKDIFLPEVVSSEKYNQVVAEINARAELINDHIVVVNEKNEVSVIFPSIDKNGNISGARFPMNFWALTYDDGPHPTRTVQISDLLYKAGVQATFFKLTKNVKLFTKVTEAVIDAGHDLALHSYSHEKLSTASEKVLEYEITDARNDMEGIVKRDLGLFRLPYGAGLRQTNVREKVASNDLVHVFWNVDSLDWKDKNPESILERVKKQMQLASNKGGVILFHDIHAQTVKATELLLEELRTSEIKFCLVEEFVKYLNQQDQNCVK